MNPILFVTDNLAVGGAQKIMLAVAGALQRQGFACQFMYLRDKNIKYAAEADAVGAFVARKNAGYFAYIWAVFRIWRMRPALIVSSLHMSNLVTALACLLMPCHRPKLIVREANIFSLQEGRAKGHWRILYPLLKILYRRRVDAFIAISQGVKDDLVAHVGVDPDKVHVIYNPVALEHIQSNNDEIPHPWLENADIPVFVGVGRFVKAKGFDLLIDAFTKVRQQRACKLLLIGDGDEVSNLKAQASASVFADDIFFAGYQHMPYPYMKHADVFVMPSRWEGLGNVLIEALACGVTPVAADCPSGPAEILDYGRYGYIVSVGNVNALMDGMLAALDKPMPQDRLLERAKFFDNERILAEYRQLLEKHGLN